MAMKQSDPAGFDTIREHYRHISSTADPTTLAGCLFEANLIEFDLLNDSCREERPPGGRVQALINALLGNGDDGVFQTFVEEFSKEKLWRDLGGTLRGEVYIRERGRSTHSSSFQMRTSRREESGKTKGTEGEGLQAGTWTH